jgi:universal stress protein A
MIELKRVLVPTDFSENSQPALQLGSELAPRFGAELFLLYVVEPSGGLQPLPDLPDDVKLDLLMDSPYARAELRLQTMPASVQSNGLTVHRHVDIGRPATVILEYSKTHDIDLIVIVIGTHGNTGWTHVLLGSVAESVVQHSKCPVLTVRSQKVRRELPGSKCEESTIIPERPALTRHEQTVE